MPPKVMTTGLLLALVGILAACVPDLTVVRTPSAEPTSLLETPVILADVFINGCAYLDTNASGSYEEEDGPIVGAVFSILVGGKAGFGGKTGENGCAYVTIPAFGDTRDFYPMPAAMKLQEGLAYKPLTPGELILEYPEVKAIFLFSLP